MIDIGEIKSERIYDMVEFISAIINDEIGNRKLFNITVIDSDMQRIVLLDEFNAAEIVVAKYNRKNFIVIEPNSVKTDSIKNRIEELKSIDIDGFICMFGSLMSITNNLDEFYKSMIESNKCNVDSHVLIKDVFKIKDIW